MSVSNDGTIEQFTNKLASVGQSRADVLGMAGFETIQDVADAPVYEVAELPCFGEQTACDAVISARTELQDADDTNDAVTADDEASEDDETMSVSQSGNPTGDRDDVVAVVAPDGRFEGMDNHEIRLELVRAFDRSPFDVAGVRTAEDFEAETIKNVLRAHNQLVADGRMGQLNVLNNTVITPWDETNGKPDVELTTTQSKYGSEHTYWNEAPSERNRRLVDGVDGVIVLSDGGHVESAVYDWVEAGVTVYNAALGETVTWGDEQSSIGEFADDPELGRMAVADTDEGRDNPRSEVENTW
jgi:hypothetical protein